MTPDVNYTYNAVVRSVYDADTIRVDIDTGFGIWHHNESIRLMGIDAPEIRGEERPDGLISKAWLLDKIPPGTEIHIQTIKDRTGKYGRYLAYVWFEGVNLNEQMVAEGMATPYLG
jgi:micrococcal nuclease